MIHNWSLSRGRLGEGGPRSDGPPEPHHDPWTLAFLQSVTRAIQTSLQSACGQVRLALGHEP